MARRRGSHLAALNRKRKLKKANDSSAIPVSTEQGDHQVENADGDESQSQDNISDLEEDELPHEEPLDTEVLHDTVNDKEKQTEDAGGVLNVEKKLNDTKPTTDSNILNSEMSSSENQEKLGNTEAEPEPATLTNESDRKDNEDANSKLKLLNESKSNEIEEAKEMEENLNKDNEEEEAVDIEDAIVSGRETNELSRKDHSTNIEDDFLKHVKVDKATGTTTFEFDGIALKYKERSSVLEEKEGLIEFRVVNSDNTRENMMVLTGLKNIFQKQLPKMPKEYIARLVYDRSHLSMAIIRKPLTVVGGITYKPFNDRGFAEIVFCAISSTEQVRGYGAHLMNHLKDYVKLTSPIKYFLTYADNYAIGYFKKQGFTKDVTLDRRLWMGYIKDYEGGTLMQCSMLPKIRYLDAGKVLLLQEAAIRRKIRTLSRMHIVQPGLEHFRDLKNIVPMNPMDIPGIQESGWTPEMDELAQKPKRGPHYGPMQSILTELQSHNAAWPFLQPVNKNEVADYYEFIKEPMDLSTMETKLENNKYENFEDFIYDARLICKNCRAYNGENTSYFKYANKLEKFFYSKVKEYPEYAGLID